MRKLSEFNYTGPSMKPLFQPGDGLLVASEVKFNQLRRGDVICFINPQGPQNVVHRIVRITDQGLITRGDNNPTADPYHVTPELNPVLVIAIRRGNKTIKVSGGTFGISVHYKNLLVRFISRHFISKLRVPLVKIANTGYLYKLKLFDAKLKVKSYKTAAGLKEFLFIGKHQAGHKQKDGHWHIRIPWRFFIDPNSIDKK